MTWFLNLLCTCALLFPALLPPVTAMPWRHRAERTLEGPLEGSLGRPIERSLGRLHEGSLGGLRWPDQSLGIPRDPLRKLPQGQRKLLRGEWNLPQGTRKALPWIHRIAGSLGVQRVVHPRERRLAHLRKLAGSTGQKGGLEVHRVLEGGATGPEKTGHATMGDVNSGGLSLGSRGGGESAGSMGGIKRVLTAGRHGTRAHFSSDEYHPHTDPFLSDHDSSSERRPNRKQSGDHHSNEQHSSSEHHSYEQHSSRKHHSYEQHSSGEHHSNGNQSSEHHSSEQHSVFSSEGKPQGGFRDGNAGARSHKSQVTSHKSQVTSHKSQVTSHKSQITSHKSQVTSHKSGSGSHSSSSVGGRDKRGSTPGRKPGDGNGGSSDTKSESGSLGASDGGRAGSKSRGDQKGKSRSKSGRDQDGKSRSTSSSKSNSGAHSRSGSKSSTRSGSKSGTRSSSQASRDLTRRVMKLARLLAQKSTKGGSKNTAKGVHIDLNFVVFDAPVSFNTTNDHSNRGMLLDQEQVSESSAIATDSGTVYQTDSKEQKNA